MRTQKYLKKMYKIFQPLPGPSWHRYKGEKRVRLRPRSQGPFLHRGSVGHSSNMEPWNKNETIFCVIEIHQLILWQTLQSLVLSCWLDKQTRQAPWTSISARSRDFQNTNLSGKKKTKKVRAPKPHTMQQWTRNQCNFGWKPMSNMPLQKAYEYWIERSQRMSDYFLT